MRWPTDIARNELLPRLAGLAFFGAISTGLLTGAAAGVVHQVSQQGRVFDPRRLTVAAMDEILILNDDAGLLHHVYVESKDFSYDSKGQKPGETVSIQFPKSGTYEVLCAIHPKMRLVVEVR